MALDTLPINGLDGTLRGVRTSRVDDLRSRIAGRVLQPGDRGWDDAVLVWNAMITKRPALVVQPETAGDVAAAVSFARDEGLLISVKGGGHNIAGTALADRGVTLDMARMRTVDVDTAARRAHVGPGCLLADVDAATQEHGLAAVLGFVSETGVAGLTLGGGFGYLARRFGWAVDNLEEVEIVTADGRVRTANRERERDLFWAVRGGGGNFGVVTRFTFRLHEVGPVITGGLIAWPAARGKEVLTAYRELTASAPRELTAALVIRLAPPEPFVPGEWQLQPIVGMLVCHSGTDPESDLTPIRALGDPVFDMVAPRPYTEQQQMIDNADPKGLMQYWKAEYLPTLTKEYCEVFLEHGLKLTSPLCYSVLFHIEGAINERPDDDGAVDNRDARFVTGFSGVWPPGTPDAEHVAWVRDAWHAIRPFSTGGNYVNFQMAEDDDARTADAYRKNLERLEEVKAIYDPANLFRVNRNIAPAR